MYLKIHVWVHTIKNYGFTLANAIAIVHRISYWLILKKQLRHNLSVRLTLAEVPKVESLQLG